MESAEDDDAAQRGRWEPVRFRFNYLPVHIALLPNGKVLAFGGSGNDETHENDPYPSEVFDPQSGETQTDAQVLEGDVFCSGHSFLGDGRLLVAGGTYKYDGNVVGLPIPPFSGLEHSYTFDSTSMTWKRMDNMANGRWYPTLVTLGNGEVLAAGGLTKHFPWVLLRSIEIFSPATGWRKLRGADRLLPLYPRMHLMPDGKIFFAGSFNTHYSFPYTLTPYPTATLDVKNSSWERIGPPQRSEREEGTTVLLPLTPPNYRPRVLMIGGGTLRGKDAIPDAEIIDLSESHPSWRPTKSMKHARYYVYAVILPDRQILVLGGRSGEKGHMSMGEHSKSREGGAMIPHDPRAVHEAELFNPDTENWQTMSAMKLDRLYHSNALLLPDGRVLAAGSNPERRVNELRIEIYDPPYFFRGNRPVIDEAPSNVSYGTEFEIRSPDAKDLDEVSLIRPSATTHCVNTEQRYVGLTFNHQGPNKVVARIPDNRNLLPLGYYMLFVSREHTPSVAKFLELA